MIVDCGHEAVAEGIGTGYATMPDGYEGVLRVCYACADESERERMRTADSMFAYVSADGRSITTWTGGRLATVTAVWTSERARKTYVQATDVHGTRWHGQGPSETGNYVKLRRSKVSS